MRRSSILWGSLVAAMVLLSACADDGGGSDRVEVVNARPDGISLRAPADGELAGITADEHCANYGKAARLLQDRTAKGLQEMERPHSAVFVYQCVAPSAAQ